jgi:hypothetical protein
MIEPSMIRDRMVAVIGPHIRTIAAVAGCECATPNV